MAEVITPDHHHTRHPSSMAAMNVPAGPTIEMVSNPDFSFPAARPQKTWASRQAMGSESTRRPASASMHIEITQSPNIADSHRRAVSTLPSFTFNASDTTGLNGTGTPPRTPEENVASTPSRHRRGGSEFVGGDSRLGMTKVVSSSPTKNAEMPLPATGPPATRRGHAHRRSAAISSHDIGSLMQPPTSTLPRLSSSLPTTPLEQPEGSFIGRPDSANPIKKEDADPFGPPLESMTERPPSRPRVGFSDNVEYIPRPLSTISSETESSMSTRRGHSVDNSISSMLSMGTPSPPSARVLWSPRSSALEDEPRAKSKFASEMTKPVEKEGQWLKGVTSSSVTRPLSETALAPPRTKFALPDQSVRPPSAHKKKNSHSHALGFDRRRSEPAMSMSASDMSRLSAVSLQSSASYESTPSPAQNEHKSSTRRIKEWAVSKISRKTKEPCNALMTRISVASIRPGSVGSISTPGTVPVVEPPEAETNLDAVFGVQEETGGSQRPTTPVQQRLSFNAPALSQRRSFQSQDSDEATHMLDLDAALGPLETPPVGSYRPRKELHSSRLTKDFNGPGGHYHRRAESDPMLPPFQDVRAGGTLKSEMADVFEEDEDDSAGAAPPAEPASANSGDGEEDGLETQVANSDTSGHSPSRDSTVVGGLGMQPAWEPERPTTSHGISPHWLSHHSGEGRGSSIIEETIVEEPSLIEGVEIVEAHEEPRASSLTKSSVSSDTPTLLVAPTNILAMPNALRSLDRLDPSETSAPSSPDSRARQGSFDVSDRGTSASSIADTRTMSSCMTGDHGQELRVSVDDVPSLTSSRSSAITANGSRREFGSSAYQAPIPRVQSVDAAIAAENQRKRGSIQSLSQLVGGSFSSNKSKGADESRPQTSAESGEAKSSKKEHRLKKLMFWKSKQTGKQDLDSKS